MAKKPQVTLENLDARVTTLEKLLPTLATKADLEAATAPLATTAALAEAKDELRAAIASSIASAVAPLGTRREMLVLHEATRSDIQLLAESVLSLHSKVDALSRPAR